MEVIRTPAISRLVVGSGFVRTLYRKRLEEFPENMTFGLELEIANPTGKIDWEPIEAIAERKGWELDNAEFISPILKNTENDWLEALKVYLHIKKAGLQIGSLHIHVGRQGPFPLSWRMQKRALGRIALAWEGILLRFLGTRPVSSFVAFIDSQHLFGGYPQEHWQSVNFSGYHPTIEFRWHLPPQTFAQLQQSVELSFAMVRAASEQHHELTLEEVGYPISYGETLRNKDARVIKVLERLFGFSPFPSAIFLDRFYSIELKQDDWRAKRRQSEMRESIRRSFLWANTKQEFETAWKEGRLGEITKRFQRALADQMPPAKKRKLIRALVELADPSSIPLLIELMYREMESDVVRKTSIWALGQLGDPTTIRDLLEFFQKMSRSTKKKYFGSDVTEAIRHISGAEAENALFEIIENRQEQFSVRFQANAIMALTKMVIPRAVSFISEMLENLSTYPVVIQIAVIRALPYRERVKIFPLLFDLLVDPTQPLMLRKAVVDVNPTFLWGRLQYIGRWRAVIVELLQNPEEDEKLKLAILGTMSLTYKTILADLKKLITERHQFRTPIRVQKRIVELFGRNGYAHKQTFSVLEEIVKSNVVLLSVRKEAVRSLESNNKIMLLAGILKQNGDVLPSSLKTFVIKMISKYLKNISRPDHWWWATTRTEVETIVGFIDQHPQIPTHIREKAIRALGNLRRPGAQRGLLDIVRDPSIPDRLRYAAIESLRKMKRGDAPKFLAKIVAQNGRTIPKAMRQAALDALITRQSPSTVHALESLVFNSALALSWRRKAIYAMADLKKFGAIPTLARVVKKSKVPTALRLKAARMLKEMGKTNQRAATVREKLDRVIRHLNTQKRQKASFGALAVWKKWSLTKDLGLGKIGAIEGLTFGTAYFLGLWGVMAQAPPITVLDWTLLLSLSLILSYSVFVVLHLFLGVLTYLSLTEKFEVEKGLSVSLKAGRVALASLAGLPFFMAFLLTGTGGWLIAGLGTGTLFHGFLNFWIGERQKHPLLVNFRQVRYMTDSELEKQWSRLGNSLKSRIAQPLKEQVDGRRSTGSIPSAFEALATAHALGLLVSGEEAFASHGQPQTQETQAFLELFFQGKFDILPPVRDDLLKRFESGRAGQSDPSDTQDALRLARLLLAFSENVSSNDVSKRASDILQRRQRMEKRQIPQIEQAYQTGWASGEWAQEGRRAFRRLEDSDAYRNWETKSPAGSVIPAYDVSGLADALEKREPLTPQQEKLVGLMEGEIQRRLNSSDAPLPIVIVTERRFRSRQAVFFIEGVLSKEAGDWLRRHAWILSGGDARSWMPGSLLDPDRVVQGLEKRFGRAARAEIYTEDVLRWKKDWRSQARALLIEILNDTTFRVFRSLQDVENDLQNVQRLKIQA